MTLADVAARVRHDLGKYVCFSARFLDDDADAPALREALADDLTRTRRGAAGTAGVAEVWAGLLADLDTTRPWPPSVASIVAAIDADVAALHAAAPSLAELGPTELVAVAARARGLAERTRELDRVVRAPG